jgi:uncharacterized membrane protein
MPIGYTTYYAGSFEDLAAGKAQIAAQEESAPEGTLALLELTLLEPAIPETLVELNSQLLSAGVPPWAGYSSVVFPDTVAPNKVYIAWTKGFAWTLIIIGIIFLILPVILGAILWFLIPQPVKDMMMMMGLMMVIVPIMGMVTKEK